MDRAKAAQVGGDLDVKSKSAHRRTPHQRRHIIIAADFFDRMTWNRDVRAAGVIKPESGSSKNAKRP